MDRKQSADLAVPERQMRLQRVLVPVDFSDCSRKALHYAIQFARQFKAELTLLYVNVPAPPPPEFVLLQTEQMSARYLEESMKGLAEWRKEIAPGISVKMVSRNASAVYQEIIALAREAHTDLIIMGNHGRTGLSRLLIGSTAERVVRHAPCPVLVIREREHDFIRKPTR